MEQTEETNISNIKPHVLGKSKPTRAQSLVELKSRLTNISTKKKLTYKEKKLKANIKSKIKRKGKQDQRNIDAKKQRMETAVDKEESIDESNKSNTSQPIKDDRMVFSKFDFSGIGKKKFKKDKQDLETQLENLKQHKKKVKELENSGDIEKVVMINEKIAWKNALAKAQGEKVKDDEELIVKSIKKREQQKKQSKKKWDARQEHVDKLKDERQRKRKENIDKRKKTKKNNKLKLATKRGKIIPGF